ncbi:MAG: alpha/beta hydrolase, partial [Proteobacteria bacterium]|nr:alpha/beta hydrolase [Pseudomonadota bacterium]
KHLNIGGPIILLGHSMGGYAAQEFTRQNPTRVQRLILVSTSRGQPDTTADVAAMQASTGQTLWQFAQQTNRTPEATIKHLFGNRFLHTQPEAYQTFLAARQAHLPPTSVSLAHFTAGGAFSSYTWAHRITAPTLVIHGTADVLVTIQSGRKLAQTLPHAHLLELYDVGHFPMLEHEHFWQFVSQFAHGQAVGMPASQPPHLMQKLWQKAKSLFHPHV